MAKDPAFPFYAQDFLIGVMYMSDEDTGRYVKLLAFQWDKGKIPKKRLGLFLGIEWVNFSDELREKFMDDPEYIWNKRLEDEREKRKKFKEKQAINGKMGGRPRKNKTQTKPKQKPGKSQTKPKQKPLEKEKEEIIYDRNIIDISLKEDWRKNFGMYQKKLFEAHQKIKKDEEWIRQQEKLNPGVDVLLSIEKAILNFWSTEAGWKNKKKAKTETINWKLTMANAISIRSNRVYKTKDEHNKTHTSGSEGLGQKPDFKDVENADHSYLKQGDDEPF